MPEKTTDKAPDTVIAFTSPEAFAADMSALADIYAEQAAQAVCLPTAHKADANDLDPNTQRPAGKRAAGQGRDGSRPAPGVNFSPLDGAMEAALKIHDRINTAIVRAGIDINHPGAAFIRDMVRRDLRGTFATVEAMDASVAKAAQAYRRLSTVIDQRSKSFAEASKAEPAGKAS